MAQNNDGHTGEATLQPEAVYNDARQRQRAFGDATEAKLLAYRQRLDSLTAEKEECMKFASDHAGAIGMVYRAETNDYVRIVPGLNRPERPERPTQPDLPAPVGEPPSATLGERVGHALSKVVDTTHWLLAIPVGLFVGYGLGSLTGLPILRQPVLMAAALVLGIGVIVGIKMLLGYLWSNLGRKKTVSGLSQLDFWSAIVVTIGLCGLEAWLGAQALVIYSQRSSLASSEILTGLVAYPLALAVSAPIVLISAVKPYFQGQRELSPEDQAERVHQHKLKQVEKLEGHNASVYAKQCADWDAEVRRRDGDHAEEVARFEMEKEELESYKKGPDFQALLKYIGRISVLNVLLAETEKEMTGYSISRGHGRASVQ